MNSQYYLSIEDVWYAREEGLTEFTNQNLSIRATLNELYKIKFYVYKSNRGPEPCPICVNRDIGIGRTCRHCGTTSCHRCFIKKWYPIPTAEQTKFGNYSIVDKRCNICHARCSMCHDLYSRSDNHVCETTVASV